MGRGTAIPCRETTCCPSATIWNKKNVPILWREMDPVMNQLWYLTGVMHFQLTAQLKVTQKAHLICFQNKANHLSRGQLGQGQPAWTPQTMGSRITVMYPSYWGKSHDQLRTSSQEGTKILCCSKVTSFLVSSIIVLAPLSAFTSCHACTSSSLGIQCKDILIKPPHICPTQMILDIDGDAIYVKSMVDFRMGEWIKNILSESSCHTRE